MAETADELSTPLGQQTERASRAGFACRSRRMQALAVLLGLFLVAFVGVALFNDNPLGGEPVARVALRKTPATDDKHAAAGPAPAPALPKPGRKSAPSRPRRAKARPSPSSTAPAASARMS